MSVGIRVADAAFSNIALGAILPKRDYLVGEYLLRGSMAETVKNRANPSLPMVEVGVVTALTITAAGSGGTDGTYNLIFSGGNPGTAAAGTFTVTGGIVTAVSLTSNGKGYQSVPAVSLTNCPGLAGATVTATRAAPTYNANSVTVRSSATAGYGFQTGIVPTENHSMILVRKPAAIAAQPSIMGMATVGALWGFREFSTSNWFSSGEGTAPNQGASRAKPSAGTVFFECGVQNVHGNGLLYYGAGGVLSSATSGNTAAIRRTSGSGASTVVNYSQVCIGGAQLADSITTNQIETILAGIYDTTLTPAEVQAAYTAVVSYLATLGITVV